MARYDETQSRWLLPEFMRNDAFDDAMASVIDEFGLDVYAKSREFSVWDEIDYLDEAALDALADELNILWYDKTADADAKRGIIRNCKRIQAKLGTPWALEEILGIYFTGGAVITEWFDYEEGPGEPNHFRVEAECFSGTAEEAGRFLQVLNMVKRNSAVLDNVIAVIGSECAIETRAWVQDARIERMEARR